MISRVWKTLSSNMDILFECEGSVCRESERGRGSQKRRRRRSSIIHCGRRLIDPFSIKICFFLRKQLQNRLSPSICVLYTRQGPLARRSLGDRSVPGSSDQNSPTAPLWLIMLTKQQVIRGVYYYKLRMCILSNISLGLCYHHHQQQ